MNTATTRGANSDNARTSVEAEVYTDFIITYCILNQCLNGLTYNPLLETIIQSGSSYLNCFWQNTIKVWHLSFTAFEIRIQIVNN